MFSCTLKYCIYMLLSHILLYLLICEQGHGGHPEPATEKLLRPPRPLHQLSNLK